MPQQYRNAAEYPKHKATVSTLIDGAVRRLNLRLGEIILDLDYGDYARTVYATTYQPNA